MKVTPVRAAIGLMGVLLVGVAIAYSVGVGEPSHDIDRLYDSPPDGALRVLFVGNSHTFVHDVPGTVQRFGDAAERPIWVEQHVVGGASLEQHLNNRDVHRRIADGDWDYVVLQEQSLRPAFDQRGYVADVGRFSGLIRQHGAEPVIYATWPRARGGQFYSQSPRFDTQDGLRTALDRAFRKAQTSYTARLAPVGSAWAVFEDGSSGASLTAADGNHATSLGAYLAAAVIFQALTGQEARELSVERAGVSQTLGRKLRAAADRGTTAWRERWSAEERESDAVEEKAGDRPPDPDDPGRSQPATTR